MLSKRGQQAERERGVRRQVGCDLPHRSHALAIVGIRSIELFRPTGKHSCVFDGSLKATVCLKPLQSERLDPGLACLSRAHCHTGLHDALSVEVLASGLGGLLGEVGWGDCSQKSHDVCFMTW